MKGDTTMGKHETCFAVFGHGGVGPILRAYKYFGAVDHDQFVVAVNESVCIYVSNMFPQLQPVFTVYFARALRDKDKI